MHLNESFIIFGALVASAVGAGIVRFVPARYRGGSLVLLAAWVVGGGVLGASGALANVGLRPPGIAYVFLATLALTAFLARSRAGAAISAGVPLWLLMGAESMRAIVEAFIDRLWHAGTVASIMTFRGGNVDMLIGLSAPVIAALYAARRLDPRVALAWNVAGLASLGNVVIRALLTAPPIHIVATEVPNAAFGTFPFSLIPTLIVPLALALHVLSIRALRATSGRRASADEPGNVRWNAIQPRRGSARA